MQFLKNHYEKVILSVVLLGLAVVVAFLPSRMPSEEAGAATPANKLPSLNLATNEAPVKHLEQLPRFVLAGEGHNLFNPVTWMRLKDLSLLKVVNPNDVGPGALQIERITPLLFALSYESMMGTRYNIGVLQETNKAPSQRGKMPVPLDVGGQTASFRLVGVRGPTDAPTEVILQLNDGKTVSIAKDKPYQVVAGYQVDLKYRPGNQFFYNKRVGDALVFAEDTNNIVDISSNRVVVSSASGKRTQISHQAAP